MSPKPLIRIIFLVLLLAGTFTPVLGVNAYPAAAPRQEASAYELILAMNQLRASYGHAALVENGTINAVAQATAQIMADNQMSWHIGDVKGRLQAAGYGSGSTVWATENFAAGSDYSIDEIMVVWADADHMLPATNGAYCHVGAGVATSSNGLTYYVLQAAYIAGQSCGSNTNTGGNPDNSDNTNSPGDNSAAAGVPPYIVPVKIATPDADGKIYHLVEAGQSFWAIAIAYQLTIKDLETWNNLSSTSKLQIGQKLFIPGNDTAGYTTPTPVGMVQTSTPDADGKIVHEVQPYQALSTIAQAYGVTVDTLLALNGLQIDWPLSIGQKLVVKPSQITPSPTPRPLTLLEQLTPASDGMYYHTVKSGEFLAWIADLYQVNVNDLMAWNGLNGSSVLQVDQKLLLQVTPPATQTATSGPPTDTPTPTLAPPTATATLTPGQPSATPTATPESFFGGSNTPVIWIASLGLVTAGGLFLFSIVSKRRHKSQE